MTNEHEAIEARVARLERLVDELLRERGSATAGEREGARGGAIHRSAGADREELAPAGAPSPRPPAGSTRPPPSPAPTRAPAATPANAESWLAKGGMALVALGLIFLFRYSIERGWITPPMRVGFGFMLGAGLYALGARVREARVVWGQVVIGGALGVLYVTVWAGAVLYALLPGWLAFPLLAAVSAEAVRQADRADRPTLGVIGGVFGFAAPVLVGDVARAAPLVVLTYAVLLAAGLVFVFLRRGWLSLQLTAAAGAFVLLAVLGTPAAAAPGPVQAAVVALWGLVAVLPVLRPPRDALELGLPVRFGHRHDDVVGFALRLSVLVPTLAAVHRTGALWDLSRGQGALVMAAAGFAYAGLAAWTAPRARGPHGTRITGVLAETATALLLIAAAIELRGGAIVAVTATILALAHVVAARGRLAGLRRLAHVGYAGLALGLVPALEDPVRAELVLPTAFAIASAIVPARLWPGTPSLAYAGAGYLYLLLWVLWVLEPLPQGALLGSAVWGGIGALVLLAGARRDGRGLERVGLATLAATAAKMLIVDLAQAETLWRIALFIGFGGMLLALGYHLQGRRAAPGGGHQASGIGH